MSPYLWPLLLMLLIYALWILYVFTMAIDRAHHTGTITTTAWVLAFPLVVVAILLDVVLNYTILALLTLDFPKSGEYTFSQRLDRLTKNTGWRGRVARWTARSLLDAYDRRGVHIK